MLLMGVEHGTLFDFGHTMLSRQLKVSSKQKYSYVFEIGFAASIFLSNLNNYRDNTNLKTGQNTRNGNGGGPVIFRNWIYIIFGKFVKPRKKNT